MDKQANIQSLYELSDYYVDADPIWHGVIKGVFTPFSVVDKWLLIGSNEKTKQKYEDYYTRIGLEDKMASIFYQYYKYGNVYVYLMPNGNIITLPPHKVRIGNISVDGEPLVEFDAGSVIADFKLKSPKALQEFQFDEQDDVRLAGYPPEVGEAVSRGEEWVQLNPKNTFVLQDFKEDWVRYAVPMITSALEALTSKALINDMYRSRFNLGMRGFLHVTYGNPDPSTDMMPDTGALNRVRALFSRATSMSGIATTNPWVNAKFITTDINDLFKYDRYSDVNAEILSAGGISGILVSGRADDGSSFATAQVSTQMAAMRIRRAKDNFAEMMNKINRRLNDGDSGMSHSNPGNVPKFAFPPTDLSNSTKFADVCYKLWQDGVLSTKTMLTAHGYDLDQEVSRIKEEQQKGIVRPLPDKEQEVSVENGDGGKQGRPTMDDSERNSDPAKSKTGAQPKPSNPDQQLEL